MKISCLATLVLVAACVLSAEGGDIEIKVEEDLILVAPGTSPGAVTVSGQPGAVFGVHPVQIMAQNKKTGLSTAGSVNQNGSFSLEIQAMPKDKIKLTFLAANGEDKKITVKVPKTIHHAPPEAEIKTETTTITLPGGAGESDSSDSGVIEQERELEESGIIQ